LADTVLAIDNQLWTIPAREEPDVPRPERPLDAAGGPIVLFAEGLRRLRDRAGSPTYQSLALSAHCSSSSLSEAAAGRRLPSWTVTEAYVRACGGDIAEWRDRWQATRAGIGRSAAAQRLATARFVGAAEAIADGADPKRSGCAADPAGIVTLDSVEVHTAKQELLGAAELRHAPTYRAAWGRFVPSNRLLYLRADATITVVAARPATATTGHPYTTAFDGQDVYGSILLAEHGGVRITVTVDSVTGGGSATTACLP
jgi:hypothetical protein